MKAFAALNRALDDSTSLARSEPRLAYLRWHPEDAAWAVYFPGRQTRQLVPEQAA
jgi:hypothetical protein